VAHTAQSPRAAILGPAGAGKSLTLRALAGLLGPSVGLVRFGADDVSTRAVEHRALGYIPQDHGLLPDRTAWQNILFAKDVDPRLAAWWIEQLRIEGVVDARPAQLSGGQRQRASIAQALSHEPRVVLLDEPFSALDAPIRAELRTLLRRLQREAGLSTVLVTHDPEEAAILADEVIVIDQGLVLQAGPTAEVFRHPASPLVARLLGVANIQEGRSAGERGISVDGVIVPTEAHRIAEGAPVRWSVRPEDIRITAAGEAGSLPGTVVDRVDLGSAALLTVAVAGLELQARTGADNPVSAGSGCQVALPAGAITVWAE
ncbi:MAG: ABC transporter ATP-binding protein, partial [Marmoricola sp.]